MRIRTFILAAFIACASLVASSATSNVTTSPAAATSASYLWTAHGNHVWTSLTANYNTSIYDIEKNGTGFIMRCWKDGVWFTGDAKTNRWFYGRVYSYHRNPYYAWVTASWVRAQATVPHC